jgi:rubrerythrin
MSLFRKAGKKFEETKQTYLDGDPEYVCRACEETVTEAFDHCPHCGEPAVAPIEDGEESESGETTG